MKLEEFIKENRAVEKWLTSVKKSSARQYGYRFMRFSEFIEISPQAFLEEAKDDITETKTRLNQWYNHLIESDNSLNYAILSEKTVRSFLRFHEISITTPKREKARRYKRKILRKEQIRKMVETAPYIRDKALIVLAFQTGMSIGDLLSLNYGDIKEAIENEECTHYVIEYLRGKRNIEAKAVIGKDAIEYLRQYINWRRSKKQKLIKKTPLFTRIRDYTKQKRLSVRSVEAIMRKIVVKAGLTTYDEIEKYNVFGFHAIRKAFSSVAKQNGIPHEQAEMSMGHKLPYDGAYDEYQNQELIENFKEAEPYLSISIDTREIEDKTKELENQLTERDQEIADLRSDFAEMKELVNTLMKEIKK